MNSKLEALSVPAISKVERWDDRRKSDLGLIEDAPGIVSPTKAQDQARDVEDSPYPVQGNAGK